MGLNRRNLQEPSRLNLLVVIETSHTNARGVFGHDRRGRTRRSHLETG